MANAILNPYLSFRDNTREVMEFYKSVFGGELSVSTFAEFQASQDPADADKVMHSQLTTESGMVLMASDTPAGMDLAPGDNIAVSLSGDDEAEVRRYWDGLIDGGTVTMPLEKAPWGDTFGMCKDKFGINWLFNVNQAQSS